MRLPIDVIKAYLLACFPELANPMKDGQYDRLSDYAQCIVKNLEAEGYVIIPLEKAVDHMIQTGQIPVVNDPAHCCGCICGHCKHQGADGLHTQQCLEFIGLQAEKILPPQSGDKLPLAEKTSAPGLIQAYFDGNGNAINGKPGLAQYRIYWPNGDLDPCTELHNGKTNNELEFLALISLMKRLLDSGLGTGGTSLEHDLKIMGDSQLVINWVSGKFRAKEPRIIVLRDEAIKLLAQLQKTYKSVSVTWVPSAENKVDAHP
jgi:ribonuclease HI